MHAKGMMYLKWFLIILMTALLSGCGTLTGILDPKGTVAYFERQLFFDSIALILVVVIPVIMMSIDFAYHYREKNHEKNITGREVEYKPEWCHSVFLECLWWGVPFVIIVVLASMTYVYTHKLDPYRAFEYPGEKLQVQVVALPWKWLFIYPEQNIASVNHLVLPEKRQVEFFLTSDNVPMSSFFIPQLGSQIYTMAGMQTKLHLIATETGKMKGLNSQYNGNGFSDMHFDVEVVNDQAFKKWFKDMQAKGSPLNKENYSALRKNEMNVPWRHYSSVQTNLFKNIMHAYMSYEHPNL